jgi:hypothetical protein
LIVGQDAAFEGDGEGVECWLPSVHPSRGALAHDLVDLQILEQEEDIDYAAVRATAERLFAARRSQPWPPTVVAYERWTTIYAEAAAGLDVIDTVDDAVAWANDFIPRTVT